MMSRLGAYMKLLVHFRARLKATVVHFQIRVYISLFSEASKLIRALVPYYQSPVVSQQLVCSHHPTGNCYCSHRELGSGTTEM